MRKKLWKSSVRELRVIYMTRLVKNCLQPIWILSGVAAQALELEKSQIQQQLNGVSDILGTAQNDLRVLLLHLRTYRIGRKKFGRRDGDDF